MFKDLNNLYLAAFEFGVNHVSDGPDDRLNLHNDVCYYLKLNK